MFHQESSGLPMQIFGRPGESSGFPWRTSPRKLNGAFSWGRRRLSEGRPWMSLKASLGGPSEILTFSAGKLRFTLRGWVLGGAVGVVCSGTGLGVWGFG